MVSFLEHHKRRDEPRERKENNKQIKQEPNQMQFIKAKMMICMKCNMVMQPKQEKLKKARGVTLGMLQTPPLKESRPEILRKKRRRTGTRNGVDLPVPKLLLYRNGATTAP